MAPYEQQVKTLVARINSFVAQNEHRSRRIHLSEGGPDLKTALLIYGQNKNCPAGGIGVA
jgi:hypothetical protein